GRIYAFRFSRSRPWHTVGAQLGLRAACRRAGVMVTVLHIFSRETVAHVQTFTAAPILSAKPKVAQMSINRGIPSLGGWLAKWRMGWNPVPTHSLGRHPRAKSACGSVPCDPGHSRGWLTGPEEALLSSYAG
ncbi:unnamed protein product, partial [Rangifer tarandus platyrhynchus]